MNEQELFAHLITRFFSEYLSIQKNLCENTILSYRDTFILLFRFLQTQKAITPERICLKDLSVECIQDFLMWLELERKCTISSRNQRLAALHSFFRFAIFLYPDSIEMSQQIINISFKKTEQKIINFLTEEQMRLLLAQPDMGKKSGIRDATLLSLLYDSAARVQELISLNIGDVNLNKNIASVTLIGKGRKIRQVPLMNSTAQLLKMYLKAKSELEDPSEPLFKNHSGTRFTRPGITYVLQKYSLPIFNETEIGFKITPHIFRHSKGMHLLRAGVNIYYIKEFLGHTNLSTTERYYVRADTEMKREALSKASQSMIPKPSTEMPVWKKDHKLMEWLKSLD